jgi:xanthine dehydrogenase accessory factor
MMEELYGIIARMAEDGIDGAVATVVRSKRSVPRHAGSRMVVRADGSTVGSVGGGDIEAKVIDQALKSIADGQCRNEAFSLTGSAGACGGEVEVFIEPIQSRDELVIVGAGHVGRAVYNAAVELPYRIRIYDDRPEFVEELPEGKSFPIPELGQHFRPNPRSIVLLCNRNHGLDYETMFALFTREIEIGIKCKFIGIVGSKGKAARLAKMFSDRPDYAARFKDVVIPVGLSIGSELPSEIAISILAEIITITRGADLSDDGAVLRMQNRPGKGSRK